ncbi:ATP-dependent chromatin assembly factor large subunit isoform X1 [Dermacentor variabilis]|uniref:ATP-dependent chromatin assembly factor large subunit isoform X1 n=1 Tax=Dermacentor variabilis TaxID=34621 RepID=UPI003F5C7E59
MPLYGKHPFIRQKPPADLKPNDEVFFCKITNEGFRNYDEYFARVILCNSLVWTCSLTGKPGLTYQDALNSEEHALKILASFSAGLRKPLLYIASLTKRGRLADLCDDVYSFARDRYFVGESVEVTIKSHKKTCTVAAVVSPPSKAKSPAKVIPGSPAPSTPASPLKKASGQSVPSDKVKYQVIDPEGKVHTVPPTDVCRKKNSFTREKNRIFLRQATELDKDGILRVKEKTQKKYGLHQLTFADIFTGSSPTFTVSPKNRPSAGAATPGSPDGKVSKPRKLKQTGSPKKEGAVPATTNGKKELAEKPNGIAAASVGHPSAEELAKVAAEAKAAKDREFEELLKLKIAQKEARQKKKIEERRLHAQFLTEWNRPRDDLECDDLRELPSFVPLHCAIPPKHFGDFMVVLEFLSLFAQQLDLKDFFPAGVSFDLLERALTETDVLGSLSDIFQLLLTAVFRTQEEEMEPSKGRHPQGEQSSDDEPEEEETDRGRGALQAIRKAQRAATTVSLKQQQVLGLKLSKVTVDALSLSEVLRLHLASSGSLDVGRKVFSGWYSQEEDPGLWFTTEEPEIMARLSQGSIHDLEIGDKVKLLRVLVDQLLSMESFRGVIEENLMKLKQLKQDLRQIRLSAKQQEEPKKKRNQKEGTTEGKKEEAEGADEDADDKAATDKTSDKPSEKTEQNGKVNGIIPEALKTPQQRKEEQRRREELERKEQALRKQVEQLQSFWSLQPLGEDRCHRRYWQFNALPGLFVEDNDPHRGACIPGGTPLVRCELPKHPSVTFMEAFLLHNNRKRGDSGDSAALSDKENKEAAAERKALHAEGKAQKLLCDSNPRVAAGAGRRTSVETPAVMMNGLLDPKRELSVVLDKVDSVVSDMAPVQPVNGTHPYGTCSGNAVTCTVHGEVARSAMPRWWFCRNKEELAALIGALNPRGFRESKLRAVLKRDQADLESVVAKCPGRKLNPEVVWPEEDEGEAEVRKSSRLQSGPKPSAMAGYPSRLAQVYGFREALLDLEEKLYTGSLGIIKVDRVSWREKLDVLLATVESTDKDQTELVKIASTLDYESEVRVLSQALLDVSMGIEARFLQPPLGESEEQRKKRKAAELARKQRKEDGEDVPEEPPSKPSLLENWRESVSGCTSVAQLFLHLSSLERSVAWDRSVLKAYCRICRRRRDPERMLLCDGCDRGHHLYCLKPPLEVIPKGDWYCVACRPKEKPASPAKRKYIEEEEDDDQDEEDEEQEDEDEEEEANAAENESEAESSSDGNDDSCDACGKGGTLICCDSCPLAYHLECTRPPLRRLPRGTWNCHKCTVAKQRSSGGARGKGTRTRSQSAAAESKRYIERRQQKEQSKKQPQTSAPSDPYRPPRISFKRSRVSWEDSSSVSEEGVTSRASSRRSSQDLPLDFKACDEILQSLVHDHNSWPFHCAVSRRDVPDYYDVIRRPMDLGKIRGKLSGMEYRTTKEFVADIYLIFQNCSVYNRPGSLEHSSGVSLLGTFERLLSHHGLGEFPHAPCFEDEATGSKRTSKRVSKRHCCDSDSEDHGTAKRALASPTKDAATSSWSTRSIGKRRTN